MMVQQGEFLYSKRDGREVIRLPYGFGQAAMYLVLPDKGVSPEKLIQEMDAANWKSVTSGMSSQQGTVSLPKFKIDYKASLNDALKQMGMEVAFDMTRADFGNMRAVPPIVYAGNVLNRAYVDVYEEGTTAAAATSVEAKVESARLESFTMICDRPFLFVIQDEVSGAVLFTGIVNDPSL